MAAYRGRMTAAAAPLQRRRPDSAQARENGMENPAAAVQRTARRSMDGTSLVRS
ncbi:MAG: hypothetical protein SO031_05875 [Candidatus Ventricola sp.]|nr:hypothetical protein [Candidatus Ventricola sp.]